MPREYHFQHFYDKFSDGNKKYDAVGAIIDCQLLCVRLGEEENPFILRPTRDP